MAPVTVDNIEKELQDVIQDLYEISVGVYAYQGAETTAALTSKIKALAGHLRGVAGTAAAGVALPVPPEVVEYVEGGRNPDIYTREFVETVRRSNALLRARAEALRGFRDVLAAETSAAKPELRPAVAAVVAATGGTAPLGGGGQ